MEMSAVTFSIFTLEMAGVTNVLFGHHPFDILAFCQGVKVHSGATCAVRSTRSTSCLDCSPFPDFDTLILPQASPSHSRVQPYLPTPMHITHVSISYHSRFVCDPSLSPECSIPEPPHVPAAGNTASGRRITRLSSHVSCTLDLRAKGTETRRGGEEA
ncbi:hypothetical protein K504DRAFT_240855 [Pleomassaria siparia CBS 279.74]|uniref:Uncharacterized protein n=1 Tax=Pleomassaria siparia CBS 279.74 TaxID=1314801 RepID=A0A6G1KDP1_9PLEO|nr:hypothetical protein K504DRAFT_240855 [Pleomassaria siparia CBS 279.74]